MRVIKLFLLIFLAGWVFFVGGVAPLAQTVVLTQAAVKITDPVKLSLAAGYKATFTCSSYFNAGRSVDQINGDELHRIYPDYREALAMLPDAIIDEDAKTVSVRYLDSMPPRIAKWRGRNGCMQLPTGYSFERDTVSTYPVVEFPAKGEAREAFDLTFGQLADRKALKRLAWPQGDKTKGRLFTKTRAGRNLNGQIAKAFDRSTYGEATETTAVLVVRDGRIIAERYRDGFNMYTPQRTWSVAKSIGASVFGVAIEQNMIALSDKANLKRWSSPGDVRGEITLENLLHMSSGLDASPAGNRTDDIYFGGGRVVDHAQTRRLVAEPNTRWYYANNDTMLLMRALREKIANDEVFWRLPFSGLMDKIGMHHTFPETDWNGDFIFSSQVYTTARDLARLGLLYLNDGVWNDERLLPKGWVEYVATAADQQPPNRRDGSRRFGYGAQFWLLGGFSGLPDDTYAALGNRGQHLVIIPSRSLLIIRRGFDDNGGRQFNIADFASDVVKALDAQ